METFVVRLRKDFRITIPKNIRELLDLKYGDLVKVSIEKVEK